MIDELQKLIGNSSNILITSHIGPDGDSISSSILLYRILRANYPDKEVLISMEEQAPPLSFIDGYDEIKFQPLSQAIAEFKPDLFILLDANAISRSTREPGAAASALKESGAKFVIIDHHEPAGKDESDIYINQQSPAVTQDIYDIFIDKLSLGKPQGYAQVAIVGIYTDTGGFIYRNLDYKKTFEIVSILLADGADIELVVNSLNKISEGALKIVEEFLVNTKGVGDCTYSFISDETTDSAAPGLHENLREAAELYRSFFLRNIEGRPWGYIVSRDLLAPSRTYSVSLRALGNSVDVSRIAAALGGGGHKPAAGAKIQCASVEEAVAKVKAAISSVK